MARIRMIKPEFFDDPEMSDLSPLARLFFIGLWTQADKEGRLVDDIRRLKARIFPFDNINCEALAVELHDKDMIRRYPAVEKHGSPGFIWVRSFTKHQRPHPKEPPSVIPPCPPGAGKRNGEPGKETASREKISPSPQSNGTRNLDSLESNGTQTQKAEAPDARVFVANGTLDPDIGERAAKFLERYPELYREHRHGARFLPKPALDWPTACDLVKTWPDDRLEKLAIVFLKTDHEFASNGSRTIRQFAALASWCDDRLRQVEMERGRS